jgi:hypothetical protein
LPFLEGLPERSAFAQDEDPRFAFFMCAANGVVQKSGSDPERFWPTEVGPLTRAGMEESSAERCTGLLAAHADKLLIVRGIRYPITSTGGDTHVGGHIMCLTGLPPSGSTIQAMSTGPSADWVIAQAFGGEPLTLYAGPKTGYVDERLSFRVPGQVVPAEGDPYAVYLALTGLLDETTGGPSPAAQSLAQRRNSINDLVRDELKALQANPRLSKADRERLDLHLSSIRDMELALPAVCSTASLDLAAIESITAKGYIEDVARLHMQLVGLAFSCNLARAATLQWGDGGGDSTRYIVDGERLGDSFHWISHRVQSDGASGPAIPDAVEKHAAIDRIRMGTLATLLDFWSELSTPRGPLFESAFALWTTDVAVGPSGSYLNLPIIIAGSPGGRLAQGQYLDVGQTHNTRLLTTLIEISGVDSSGFADGQGGLPEVLV